MWLLISISRSPWNSDCPPPHHLADSEDWLPLMILIVFRYVTPPVTLVSWCLWNFPVHSPEISNPPPPTYSGSGSRCGWYCHLSHFINDAWFIYNFKQIIKGWFSKTWSFLLSMWKSCTTNCYCTVCLAFHNFATNSILYYFQKKTQSKTTQNKSNEYGYTLHAVLFNKVDLIAE